MVGRMSRPITVLAMTVALLAAAPLAASAAAPPAAGLEPTALCSQAPPPPGFTLQSTHPSCGMCQLSADRWENLGWRAYCYEAFPGRQWHLYVSPA